MGRAGQGRAPASWTFHLFVAFPPLLPPQLPIPTPVILSVASVSSVSLTEVVTCHLTWTGCPAEPCWLLPSPLHPGASTSPGAPAFSSRNPGWSSCLPPSLPSSAHPACLARAAGSSGRTVTPGLPGSRRSSLTRSCEQCSRQLPPRPFPRPLPLPPARSPETAQLEADGSCHSWAFRAVAERFTKSFHPRAVLSDG